MSRDRVLLCLMLGTTACSTRLPRPMTAGQLVRLDSPEALVAYLAQPEASPMVCDPHAVGPHLVSLDEPSRAALVRGLTDGTIAPAVWSRCLELALGGADGPSLLDAVATAYGELIADAGLETSPARQDRLAALQTLYATHATHPGGHPAVVGPVFDDVRTSLARKRLGPVAARFADDLVTSLDLGQGRFHGSLVDAALVDALFARRDDLMLRRFVAQLPSEALRDQARRRVVELAIAGSDYPEVRADAARVEEQTLQSGFNRVAIPSPSAEAMTATFHPAEEGVRRLLVRQDVANQTATLLGDSPPSIPAPPSVLPSLSLRRTLWVSLPGLSRSITTCQPPEQLDPSPCIDAGDVRLDGSLTYRDRDGRYRFVENLGSSEVAALARAPRPLRPAIRVGGRQVTTLELLLRFERPADAVFAATNGEGPSLHVAIDRVVGGPLVFTISRPGNPPSRVVVEESDLPAFHIVSRGAAGSSGNAGSNGWDGSAGMDGSSASCPSTSGSDGTSGSSGGDGGAGGDGEDGGNGGDIDVEVDCGAADCSPALLGALRKVVVSAGGTGGAGGRGGNGGRGGRGARAGRARAAPTRAAVRRSCREGWQE